MNYEAYSVHAVKRAGWQFLSGKGTSALLTFIILLWLVRRLPLAEYGAYVTFIAATELVFAISFIGLPWLAARYIPEFRIHGTRGLLAALCWQLVGIHSLIVLGFALVLEVLLKAYLDWLKLAEYLPAAQVYLLVVIAEAIGRFTRDGVLGALLQHGVAQLSQVLRNLVFLTFLVAFHFHAALNLVWVAWAELAASSIASLFALAGLGRYLAKLDSQPKTQTWTAPSIWRMWPTALRMYAAQLLTLANSQQVLLNLVQMSLGASAAATYGFLRNLYEQLSRYLPATLFLGLVQPKLVASYTSTTKISELSKNANLAGKLSLLALMPAVAFTAVGGESLVGWLSGGKFPDTRLLFFGLIVALIPQSQKQLLETVAVITGYADLCIRAAIVVLTIPPLIWLMLKFGMGLWSPVIGVNLGQLIFVFFVTYGVSIKSGYQTDFRGLSRLTGAGIIGFLGAISTPAIKNPFIQLTATGVFTVVSYLIAAWYLQPITENEKNRLLSFIFHKHH